MEAAGNPVNEVAQDRTHYGRDAPGRLVRIQQGEAGQVVVAFTYDHAGRRISRAVKDVQGALSAAHYP